MPSAKFIYVYKNCTAISTTAQNSNSLRHFTNRMVKDAHTVERVNEAIDDNHLWYLAYGSNMNKKIFQGLRKIVPLQHKVVTVPEYWLSLDMMGSPYIEPCFASILKRTRQNITEGYAREIHLRCKAGTPFKWNPDNPGESLPPTLHGVAYLITKDQFKRILMTEGGWGYDDFPAGYSVVDVECKTYDAEKIVAKTLIGRPASVKIGCQASERYLNLMREGAKEFGFDPTYQTYLFSLQPYRPDTVGQKIARFLYLISFLPVYALLLPIMKQAAKRDRRIPRPLAWFWFYFGKSSHFAHDRFFKPIFGSGENTGLNRLHDSSHK